MNNLQLDFEDDIESLRLDDIDFGEINCKASKNLMDTFYIRRDEIKTLLKTSSLSSQEIKDLKLELRMINTSIKEYEA